MDEERIARAVAEVMRRRSSVMQGEVLSVDGLDLHLRGVVEPGMNPCYVRGEPVDAAGAFAEAERIYDERGVGFGIDLQAGRHPKVDATVRDRGLTQLFSRPLMAATAREVRPAPPPPGVDIVRSATPADLDRNAEVDAAAFGGDAETARVQFPDAILDLVGAAVVLAVEDGRAVGSGIATAWSGTVGIFGIGVVEEARGRGIGAALTSYLARAVGEPDDVAWLHPSDLAIPMYARLGFLPGPGWEVWVR